jgi:hypothetical protein
LSGKLDLTQTDFRNGGQMVKYHSSLYEIALYDKVKDMEQAAKYGERRGIEFDYGEMNDLFANQHKPEVLRFEVRLTGRKIKSLFRTLGFKQSGTLKELFDGNLSRAVMLHYWQVITDGLYVMNINANDIERLIHSARTVFPRKRSGKIMELLGFIIMSQKLGIRGARIALNVKSHQWYRLKADIKILETSTACPRFLILAGIKQQLQEFIPLAKGDLTIKNCL